MIEKKHNEKTKNLFKKILLFIDNNMITSINEKPEVAHKNLAAALINIRDVIFSEIVRDNQIEEILNNINEQSVNTKKKLAEEHSKDLNQETKSEQDQES